MDEQLVQLFLGPNEPVLGWTNSWSTLGYICHKDITFLRPSLHGPKRAGRIVTRTKGRGTKRQGTVFSRATIISQKYHTMCVQQSPVMRAQTRTRVFIGSIEQQQLGHKTQSSNLKKVHCTNIVYGEISKPEPASGRPGPLLTKYTRKIRRRLESTHEPHTL